MKTLLTLIIFFTSLTAEVLVEVDYLDCPAIPKPRSQNGIMPKGIIPQICNLNQNAARGEDIARGAMSGGLGAGPEID